MDPSNFGAYLGIGLLCLAVAVMWLLADKPQKKAVKKTKHKNHK